MIYLYVIIIYHTMKYIPSHTGNLFHSHRNIDTGFVRGLMGPIGSGKSVTCTVDLLLIAMDQEPDEEGIRRTRFAIIRNTYRELLDTTVETFFTWIPQETGHWSALNMLFTLEQELDDGTSIYTEFLFRALDKPDDIKKLLSLELTAAWINEAREIAKPVVDMVQGRVGRYPPPVLGSQATFFGLIMDTNPPDSDHWWHTLFEENIPDNHKLFCQPSGVSENAENIKNLPRNYYKNMQAGKSKIWIDVYVHGKYGYITNGMSVYPEFLEDIHILKENAKFDPNEDLWVGLDFGRTPAATFAQLIGDQWVFLDEITTVNTGAVKFAQILGKKLRQEFRCTADTYIFGDPSGDYGNEAGDDTPFSVLQDAGIDAYPAPSQDPVIRREAMARQMTIMSSSGKPRLAVSPKCKMLVKGLSGGFKYKRVQVAGDERYKNMPDKNKYSHVCESAEYLLVGAGEDVTIVGNSESVNLNYDNLNTAA